MIKLPFVYKVEEAEYLKYGFNWGMVNGEKTKIRLVLLLPIPILIYRKWTDFCNQKLYKGFQMLEVKFYFCIRTLKPKYDYEIRFNWNPILSYKR